MKAQQQQIFTLNGERFVVAESGNLIPFVEEVESVEIKKNPWDASNSIAETCKILKLGRNTVIKLIDTGELEAIKAGERRLLIPGWSIENFLRIPKS